MIRANTLDRRAAVERHAETGTQATHAPHPVTPRQGRPLKNHSREALLGPAAAFE